MVGGTRILIPARTLMSTFSAESTWATELSQIESNGEW